MTRRTEEEIMPTPQYMVACGMFWANVAVWIVAVVLAAGR